MAASVLNRGPDVASLSLAELQSVLDAAHGPFSSPLVAELAALGWETSELILGVPELRNAWVREHGPVPSRPGISDPDVLLALAEARRLRPDVVLDSNLNVLDRGGRDAIRAVAPSVRVLAAYMGTEKRFHRAISLDLVLVPCRSMADVMAPLSRGRVAVLPHSFDPRIVAQLPDREVRHPLVFAGALGPRYTQRHDVLLGLLAATDIEAWIGLRKGVARTDDGWLVTTAPDVAESQRSLQGRLVDLLPTRLLAELAVRSERLGEVLNARLARRTGGVLAPERPMRDPAADHPDRCHPPVTGTDYLALLRSAGAVVHRGIDALGACGGALRLFEVTGVGAALLVEDSPTVRELFAVGTEVLTYENVDEAIEKARWLSSHPEEREQIARAGQERTLRDHTAAARAKTLDPILREALAAADRR
jgi:hypothetical protein